MSVFSFWLLSSVQQESALAKITNEPLIGKCTYTFKI